MATWSPDPKQLPWLEVVASATFTAAPIVAVDEDGNPAQRYELAIIHPRQKIIGMLADSREEGLVISVPQVITGLYPPLEIEFQTPLPGDLRQTGWCEDFPEIPGAAVEIIRFAPRLDPWVDWTLRVTAYFRKLSGAEYAEQQDYVLRVIANWTPGRDALKEVVDARRHSTWE